MGRGGGGAGALASLVGSEARSLATWEEIPNCCLQSPAWRCLAVGGGVERGGDRAERFGPSKRDKAC